MMFGRGYEQYTIANKWVQKDRKLLGFPQKTVTSDVGIICPVSIFENSQFKNKIFFLHYILHDHNYDFLEEVIELDVQLF